MRVGDVVKLRASMLGLKCGALGVVVSIELPSVCVLFQNGASEWFVAWPAGGFIERVAHEPRVASYHYENAHGLLTDWKAGRFACVWHRTAVSPATLESQFQAVLVTQAIAAALATAAQRLSGATIKTWQDIGRGERQMFLERAEEAVWMLIPERHHAAVAMVSRALSLPVDTVELVLQTYPHALRNIDIPPAGKSEDDECVIRLTGGKMRTMEFKSKREGVEPHVVTVQDDGAAVCSCPGFTHRQACWHVTEAKERIALEQESGDRAAQ